MNDAHEQSLNAAPAREPPWAFETGTPPAPAAPAAPPAIDDCWNRIGAFGDRSCAELNKHVHCRNCPVYASAGTRLFEREPPPELLEERTRRLAECDEPVATDTATVLIFRLGQEWFALDVVQLLEVTELRTIHIVPNRIGGLLQGVVNIRGELQLCVLMDRLMSIKRAPGTQKAEFTTERLVVAEHQGQRWAFPVDEVSGVHRLPLSQLTDLPATIRRSSSRLTRGVFDWESRRVGYLDAERIFPLFEQGVR